MSGAPVAEVQIRPADPGDLNDIRDILNHEIATSTASWTTIPKSVDDMAGWFTARRDGGFPVLVAEVAGTNAGYASFGPFRSGEGYAGTVEHTVYVAKAFRRRGIARMLLQALITAASEAGFRRMVGGVSSGAEGSHALHTALDFVEAGRLPGIGMKFGRDLDLIFMVRRLDQT